MDRTTHPKYGIAPIIFCGLSIPVAVFLWLGNVTVKKILTSPDFDENTSIPPTRWLFACSATFVIMLYGIKRKSISPSGCVLGVIVGIVSSVASHAFFAVLVTFFLSSSRATKFRAHLKRKIESDFKEGGQRNWIQVLCNSGMPTLLCLLYLLDCGSGERPINFTTNYRCSWLGIGVLGAYSCCNGDTWASELGGVLSASDPFLITTWKKVPRGTNGGVSIVGLILSFLGGVVIGSTYYLVVRYTVGTSQFLTSPPQWPIIIFGGIGGFFGSLVDSVLGATIQYSGIDPQGKIVDKPGKGIKHISGLSIVDNHSVNLISHIVTALVIPMFAAKFWPSI